MLRLYRGGFSFRLIEGGTIKECENITLSCSSIILKGIICRKDKGNINPTVTRMFLIRLIPDVET